MFYPMLCKRKTYLFVPTASISSIKTMDGESSSTTQKSSRTNLDHPPNTFVSVHFQPPAKMLPMWNLPLPVPNSNPRSLLLDCTSCIGANNNPKQQNPSILSSSSCTHKAHLGKQCLSSPRFPVKDNTLRRLDTNVFIKLWMCERQLHCLLNLLNL